MKTSCFNEHSGSPLLNCSCGITHTHADICFTVALGSVLAGCYTQVPHRSTFYQHREWASHKQPQGIPRAAHGIHGHPTGSPWASHAQPTCIPRAIMGWAWAARGQPMYISWPSRGHATDIPWAAHGQSTDTPWAAHPHRWLMDCPQAGHGQPTGSPWTSHRQPMSIPRTGRGQSIGSPGADGQPMGSPWTSHGQLMG